MISFRQNSAWTGLLGCAAGLYRIFVPQASYRKTPAYEPDLFLLDPNYVHEPSNPMARVCEDCGRTYWDWWAHTEECP